MNIICTRSGAFYFVCLSYVWSNVDTQEFSMHLWIWRFVRKYKEHTTNVRTFSVAPRHTFSHHANFRFYLQIKCFQSGKRTAFVHSTFECDENIKNVIKFLLLLMIEWASDLIKIFSVFKCLSRTILFCCVIHRSNLRRIRLWYKILNGFGRVSASFRAINSIRSYAQ